ncbi:MAG: hypothetical protein B6242_02730 [Anaerolineaceae bacterium 4572_78]|nr:MAG: hypothetical protein B6242_02730 [Anaerolineaceae bacterium 4572_78]
MSKKDLTKLQEHTNTRKIAMLIDGDNAQPSLMSRVLTESRKYGSLTIRRIYGDWTTANMKGWKESLHSHAIQPIQQFRYTVGKNATDSAMIIDAMDILHDDVVDGFCVVSSDSDYTRLATRIREGGIFVIGIGEKKTPKSFVNACDVFVYTENLVTLHPEPKTRKSNGKAVSEYGDNYDPIQVLVEAFDMAVDEDEWVHVSTLGLFLRQVDPGFDPRSYGFKQLSRLLKASADYFELKYQDVGTHTDIYVRLKEPDPRPVIIEALQKTPKHHGTGWTDIRSVNSYLRNADPSFDPHTYGYKQLTSLIKSYPDVFAMKHHDDGNRRQVYIRLRQEW